MTCHDHAGGLALPGSVPGSPPDLWGSKSSKSSSFHSSYQSDNSILSDVAHFEDIGLDDEARADVELAACAVKRASSPYAGAARAGPDRRAPRELTAAKPRPQYPSLRGQIRGATSHLGLLPVRSGGRRLTGPSARAGPAGERKPAASPGLMRSSSLSAAGKARRGSWQATRERKTAQQLELECDEDDGDDVPDECFLENVPMSPRPRLERMKSMPAATATSPDPRARPRPKEKVRSVGNGTSPRPAEQGELRSPHPLPGPGGPSQASSYPNGRAKSWTAAHSELSAEAQALTEALEAHAEDEANHPRARRSFTTPSRKAAEKPRVKSALAELPPLRRTDIMIDPLPISKEKEAVLSRTRPSWLPPKNPAEEKRHLKEYRQMMAAARRAEQQKDARAQQQTTCRDDTASSLLRIWEEHVLPHWDEVTRQKRTRELWWRGIAPRSRGAVWARAIGNPLGLSDASYAAALRRAQALEGTIRSGRQLSPDEEGKKLWLDALERDVQATYPELRIFQPDGPLHGALRDVLKAYAMYRSDVGYVLGTATTAALLLLNLPTPAASFRALANLLNRPLALSFHTGDAGAITRTYALLTSTLHLKSPRLAQHLAALHASEADFATYLGPMFTSLFTGVLSLDHATRLWDVMVFEGDATLVRAAVAFLTELEVKLFGAASREEVVEIVRTGVTGLSEEAWMRAVRGAGKA